VFVCYCFKCHVVVVVDVDVVDVVVVVVAVIFVVFFAVAHVVIGSGRARRCLRVAASFQMKLVQLLKVLFVVAKFVVVVVDGIFGTL